MDHPDPRLAGMGEGGAIASAGIRDRRIRSAHHSLNLLKMDSGMRRIAAIMNLQMGRT
jgi:hypothetical protein